MALRPVRYALYSMLFACSTVLLGLTAYRIHYTKSLDNGDILTTRSHFYDPRIAALLSASIVSLIFSIAIIGMMAASFDALVFEHLSLWIIWIFFLISTALVTRQFSNLKWCRSHNKVCSVLETIKAFGWICWGFLSFLLIATLFALMMGNDGGRGMTRGSRGATSYEGQNQTRQTAQTTVHSPGTTQGTNQRTTALGTNQGAKGNPGHGSQPQTQSDHTAGALYQDNPVEADAGVGKGASRVPPGPKSLV